MKKTLIILGMFFLTLGLLAQEEKNLMEDLIVVPPKFKGTQTDIDTLNISKSFLTNFLEYELSYPRTEYTIPQEGMVVVEFTVNKDGSLSNFNVINSASFQLDEAVITCLRKTDGMWIPGKVDEESTSMEKRVVVKYDVANNPSFPVLASEKFHDALKRYNRGIYIQKNAKLSEEKRNKKSQRMFRLSLDLLKEASSYYPESIPIIFWQAANYKMLGEEDLMMNKLIEMETLAY